MGNKYWAENHMLLTVVCSVVHCVLLFTVFCCSLCSVHCVLLFIVFCCSLCSVVHCVVFCYSFCCVLLLIVLCSVTHCVVFSYSLCCAQLLIHLANDIILAQIYSLFFFSRRIGVSQYHFSNCTSV